MLLQNQSAWSTVGAARSAAPWPAPSRAKAPGCPHRPDPSPPRRRRRTTSARPAGMSKPPCSMPRHRRRRTPRRCRGGTDGRIDVALERDRHRARARHAAGRSFASPTTNYPVTTYARSNFITAKAAAPGTWPPGDRASSSRCRRPARGFRDRATWATASPSAAVEAMSRHLAGELGARGVRVVCIRPHAIPRPPPWAPHPRGVRPDGRARRADDRADARGRRRRHLAQAPADPRSGREHGGLSGLEACRRHHRHRRQSQLAASWCD